MKLHTRNDDQTIGLTVIVYQMNKNFIVKGISINQKDTKINFTQQ